MKIGLSLLIDAFVWPNAAYPSYGNKRISKILIMKFRTELTIPENNLKIAYEHSVLLMGSCFSDHIGKKLIRSKFQALNNPLGIVFNPISLVRQLEYIVDPSLLATEQLIKKHGLWHHFDFHGCFSGPDKDLVYEHLSRQLEISRSNLIKAKHLFLTLGTANVFINKGDNNVVANNHKFPIEDFIKHRLTIEEIKRPFLKVIEALNAINPELQIVFTISPVRYTREGLVENSRSKATLHMAIDEIQSLSSNVSYFPAFEVFVDDLRDYRYYNSDLIHPNEQGIEYVWELFKSCFFDEKTIDLEKEICRIIRSTEHRPIHVKSALHIAFLEKLNDQIEALVREHPFLNMKRELDLISKALNQAL